MIFIDIPSAETSTYIMSYPGYPAAGNTGYPVSIRMLSNISYTNCRNKIILLLKYY